MKAALFSIALAFVLSGCGREQPANPAQVEAVRQGEKASDEAEPLDDSSLTKIVREALQSESSLDARKIDVENRGGAVALHGTVASEEQKDKAGRIVGSVGGVTTVDNRLTVDEGASAGPTGSKPGEPPIPPGELPK